MRQVSFVPVLLLLCCWCVSAEELPGVHGEGLINGIQGLAFWPAAGDSPEMGPRDPSGCFVHLRPKSEPRVEVVLACGEWHLPPRCNELFMGWLEQGYEVSTQFGVMTGDCQPGVAKTGTKVLVPMGPAGIVALESGRGLGQDDSFRTLSSSGFARRTFDPAEAEKGYLVPVGQAVSVISHSEGDGDEEYVAVTKPFALQAESTVTVAPVPPPRELGSLIVKLRGEPELIPKVSADVVGLTGQRTSPGFAAAIQGSKILIFFDLPVGTGTIVVSGEAWAPPAPAELVGGRVKDEVIEIQPLPSLEVTYKLPNGVCRDIELRVTNVVSGAAIQIRTLEAETGLERFSAVPAMQLVAELWCDQRVVRGLVDLTHGNDGLVNLEPKAFTVKGTLFVDEKPTSGIIEFEADRDWIRALADEDGAFSCMLFNQIDMIRARVNEASDWKLFGVSPPINEDHVKDLYLPAGAISVEVLSSSTSEPISGARVGYVMEEFKRGGGEPGGRQGGRSLVTDAEGKVLLPPMFEGELELSVTAPGFKDGRFALQVLGDGKDSFVVQLESEATKGTVELLLTSGAPAAGASVLLTNPGYGAQTWKTVAAADGRAKLPDVPATVIFVFHPDSGLYGQLFRFPAEHEIAPRIVLPSRAPGALVRFVSAAGTPVPGAMFILRVNGLTANYIIQNELAPGLFPMMADGGGVLRIDGVSAAEPGILAWDPTVRFATEDALYGIYDGLFSQLRPDHTGMIEVEVVSSLH